MGMECRPESDRACTASPARSRGTRTSQSPIGRAAWFPITATIIAAPLRRTAGMARDSTHRAHPRTTHAETVADPDVPADPLCCASALSVRLFTEVAIHQGQQAGIGGRGIVDSGTLQPMVEVNSGLLAVRRWRHANRSSCAGKSDQSWRCFIDIWRVATSVRNRRRDDGRHFQAYRTFLHPLLRLARG